MASGSANRAYHSTITTASVAETVTLNQLHNYVTVYNRSANDLFFTTDGTTPTVGGAETFVCPANSNVGVVNEKQQDAETGETNTTVVTLISATASGAYSVLGD